MPATLPRPTNSPAPATPAKKPLRSRHEAFCQHFVLGGNATYAAMKAGYTRKWASNQGYRLMRQEAIRVRIGEIRSTLARAYCLDADVLLGKLEAIYQSAHENNQFHAAARAVEIQARIARQAARSGAAGSATGTQQEARTGEARTGKQQEARTGEARTGKQQEARPRNQPETEMTTNDEFSRPGADGFHSSSIAYGPGAGQK